MPKPPRPWTVLPHDPIEKLEENFWAVEADLPKMALRRRMSIIRLGDGRLVFHNGIPLAPAAMTELERWGEPAILLVPNGMHRLDVHAFKERYGRLLVLCPLAAAAQVRKKVAVDGTYDLLPADPALRVESLDGVDGREAAIAVRSGVRLSLLFADAVFNVPHLPGLGGFILRLLGSSGGPKVTPIARLSLVKDRAALRESLLRLSRLPELVRLVPSHGRIVDQDAAATLRRLAEALR